MTTQTVLYVCEDVPVLNAAGHTTYINAMLTGLSVAGYRVHVLVTGSHLPSLWFRFSVVTGLSGVESRIPKAWCLGGDLYLARPLAMMKWVYRKFVRPLTRMIAVTRAGSADTTPVHIGAWLRPAEAEALASKVADLKPGLIFIDTVFRTPMLDYLPASGKAILVGHDVFHQRCSSLIASGLRPVPCVSLEEEASALRRFDGLIGISAADAAAYSAICTQTPVIALPSPVQLRTGIPPKQKTNHIFYLGSQGPVNVDGLNWFLDAVWPTVKAGQPDLILDVVGGIGAQIQCSDPSVRIHGRLDDFSAIASEAMFAINPVRAGSGLKIKMLDYFAHGLGCITTSIGAAGFPEDAARPIAVCDEASAFAAKVLEWCADLEQCRRLSENAQRYVRRFSAEEFNEGLSSMIQRVTGNDARPALAPGTA